MPVPRSRQGPARPERPGGSVLLRSLGAVGILVPLLAGGVSAQELPLKREVPGAAAFQCPETALDTGATPEERGQAEELGSLASQAVILGEMDRARELLDRATELDPGSAELAYRYGRVLEDDGEVGVAIDAYCRVLTLEPAGVEAREARARIDALARSERESLPDEAVTAFRTGLQLADAERIVQALDAFDAAVGAAPGWAGAVYNRGILRARARRWEDARDDLRRYLELRPDAPDAIAVSEGIGRLETTASLPSAGATFLVGLLPGAGQFYSGRPVAGLGVLTLFGGALATALLVEDVEVLCLSDPGPGADCPPEHVLDEQSERPYLVAGLGAAAAVTVLGAVEAFLHVRGQGAEAAGFASLEIGGTRVVGPALERGDGGRIGVRLLQIRH
ncbi:MAG: tetratricopeptide repeat protein [Gemmatimonadota bacterium]